MLHCRGALYKAGYYTYISIPETWISTPLVAELYRTAVHGRVTQELGLHIIINADLLEVQLHLKTHVGKIWGGAGRSN